MDMESSILQLKETSEYLTIDLEIEKHSTSSSRQKLMKEKNSIQYKQRRALRQHISVIEMNCIQDELNSELKIVSDQIKTIDSRLNKKRMILPVSMIS